MPQITWLKMGLSLGVLLFAFVGGYELRVLLNHSNERAQLKAQAEAQAEAQARADAAAANWAAKLAVLRDDNSKLLGRLNHEISKAIYSTCVVPADGVQLYNDAVR